MSRNSDLNFDINVRGGKEAVAQFNAIRAEIARMPNNINTSMSMSLHDRISAKLMAIYATIQKILNTVFDVNTKGLLPKLKALKTLITGMFKTDDSKKWYEKIFGFLTGIGKQAEKVGTIVAGIFGIGGAVVAAGLGVAMGLLVKSSISLNSQMEQFEVSLQTTLGSLTAAKNEMKGIVQFAKETPYAIQEVTDAVVKLRAYAMDPAKWLRPLGDMASAFGRTVTDAVEAAADAAMGMFRRSLSYGIRMERADFKQGGKYAGMSYAEAFLMEVEKRFKGGMLLQAQTLKGIWSNIKDTMTIQITTATKPIYNAIKSMVSDFYNKINDPAYAAKLQERFAAVTKVIYKVVNSLKSFVNYVQINLVPVFASFGEAALKTFTSIVKIVGTFTDVLGSPIVTVIANAIYLLSEIVVRLQWFIKAIIALKLLRFIFTLLSKDIALIATNMAATGAATGVFAAKLSILANRAIKAGAAILGMMVISKFLETRTELKAVGDTFDEVAGGADKVKGYLKNLGEESGQTLDNMAKAANAAKEFGVNAVNALEKGVQAAKLLNLSAEESVQIIGKLAKAYIGANTPAGDYAKKTAEVASALETLKFVGIQMDDTISVMEQYPRVMEHAGESLDGLTKIIIAYSAATNGAGSTKLFEMLDNLLTPDAKMLSTLDPTIWVSKSTKDLRDLGTEGQAYAEVIEEILKRNNILGQSFDSLGNYLGSNVYTMNELVFAIKKLSAQEMLAQEAVLSWSDVVQQVQEDLDDLQNQLDKVNIRLTALNDTMNQTSNVLNLAMAVNQMKAYNEIIAETGMTIAQMNNKIAQEEAGLAILQTALTKVTNKFEDISDKIQDAQERLDKFTHPRLEGMGAFDDKLHGIDTQLNSLKRQKLDLTDQLRGFEQAGLTGTDAYRRAAAPLTAIQAAIDKLENDREKTQLDQSIAYDDQLYQLGKIADAQKEITFDAAVSGAKAARAEIDRLAPQMEIIAAQKDNLEAQVKVIEGQIKLQKDLVAQKEAEIELQNSALKGELERLELQKKIYEYEASIVDKKLEGARIDALTGKVSPGNLALIQSMYGDAAKESGGLTQQASSIQSQMAILQFDQKANEKALADAQASLSAIQGDMKALTTVAPQLIKSLNYDALVAEHQDALEAVFGKDNANVLKSMEGLLAMIAKGTNGPPGQSDSLGWTGKVKNFMTGSTAGLITTGILGVLGYKAGKNLIPKLATKVGSTISSRAASGSVIAQDIESMGLRKLVPNQVASRIPVYNKGVYEVANKELATLEKQLVEAERTRAAAMAATELTNAEMKKGLSLTDKYFAASKDFDATVARIESQRGVIEQAATARLDSANALKDTLKSKGRVTEEAVKTARTVVTETQNVVTKEATKAARKGILGKGGGLIEKIVMGGIFGSALTAENVKGFKAGKGFISNSRSLSYLYAKIAGHVEAANAGKMVPHVNREVMGKISSKIMNKLRHPLGILRGQSGAASLDALTFGLGGRLERPALSSAAELAAGGTRTISTDMAMRGATQYGPNGKLNVQPDLVKRYAAEAKKTGKVAESIGGLKITAVIDKNTGEIAILDGHNRIAAAKKAGIKSIQADFSTGNWEELTGDVKKRVPGKTFPNISELEKSGSKVVGLLTKIREPLVKLGELGSGKVGAAAKLLGKGGLLAGLGDVSQLAKPIEKLISKFGSKAVGSMIGKGLGFLGKTLMGAGPAGLAMLGVEAVNFLKGDFMNEKVWSKMFGGKTIQEFTKDNPVSRYLYSAFGKENVEQMFKPIGNLWDGATHAVASLGNVGGMATGVFKGIFTGNWDTLKNNAAGFAKNVTGMFEDAGKAVYNGAKALTSTPINAIKTLFGGGQDQAAVKLAETQLEIAEKYGKAATDLQKKINKTKDLDQREALRMQLYNMKKDIDAKRANISDNVKLAQEYGKAIITLEDQIKNTANIDQREELRAQMYAYQRELKKLQTGLTSDVIKNANFDIDAINSQLHEIGITTTYDDTGLRQTLEAYATTKDTLADPIRVLVTAELDKQKWNEIFATYEAAGKDITDISVLIKDEIAKQYKLIEEATARAKTSTGSLFGDIANKITSTLQALQSIGNINQLNNTGYQNQVQQYANNYGTASTNAVQGDNNVAQLQQYLKNAGYSVSVDNIMGPKTRSAALDLLSRLDRVRDRETYGEIQKVLNSYQHGGVTEWARNQAKLAIVHGQEAVIPLVGGAVPVRFTNGGQGSNETPSVVNVGDITFIVRDDNDIETMKSYMLKLLQGQAGFIDNPSNY